MGLGFGGLGLGLGLGVIGVRVRVRARVRRAVQPCHVVARCGLKRHARLRSWRIVVGHGGSWRLPRHSKQASYCLLWLCSLWHYLLWLYLLWLCSLWHYLLLLTCHAYITMASTDYACGQVRHSKLLLTMLCGYYLLWGYYARCLRPGSPLEAGERRPLRQAEAVVDWNELQTRLCSPACSRAPGQG